MIPFKPFGDDQMNMREFVAKLDQQGLITRIDKEVDPVYEVSTLMKHLDGQALLFTRVKGQSMPVIANTSSTRDHVALGLNCSKDQIIEKLTSALEKPVEPEIKEAPPYDNLGRDLSGLPILTYYPVDGGPYIASSVVISNDAEYGRNASYHRIMVLDQDRVVLRILQRNFESYIERGLKEFAICIGNSVAVQIAAAISMGIDVDEMAIANALEPTPLIEVDGHIVPEAEIIMIAEFTGERADEGPFLDLTETPDIVRSQRVARIKAIHAKPGAMFHGLLPGGLEHKTLMGMPREPTIFAKVAEVCEVKDVLITPGGCSWLHGAVSIKVNAPDDGRKAIEAAFAGHKSMKHVFVVNDDIDIHDPHAIEWAMATRFQAEKDLVIKERQKGSSLDPSSNLETRETTKVGFDLTIPPGKDPKHFTRPDLPLKLNAADYLED